ncbi:MAG: long-chain fatty acid--CoA ligase [Acidobacteriota bacterium]
MVATLNDLFFHLREHSAGNVALLAADGAESWSTAAFVRAVHSLALALESAGLERGERVALSSENRPEWHVVDFACHLLGAVPVPLPATWGGEQLAYGLRNSGAGWLFFAGGQQVEAVRALDERLVRAPRRIAFDAEAALEPTATVTRWMGEGAKRLGDVPIERFRGRVGPDDLASILYTSGTTGEPKGVRLSHRNLVSNFRACARLFELSASDRALSMLPLSHVFQRTVDYLCLYRGVSLVSLSDPSSLVGAARRHRPTVLAAAPEVFEAVRRRVLGAVAELPQWRRRLFRWGLDVGRRYAEAERSGFLGPGLTFQRWLAARWAHRSVQRRFGGRLRLAISGGAPLDATVLDFFEAVGVPLYEGYGLTETSPVLATNSPGRRRLGSVGKPLEDVELRLAEDGEILVRGPGVMQGYWQDAEATGSSIDASGWFATGDLGEVDASGYLFITDRKRDLLALSNGHKVTPRPIEALLRSEPGVVQAVVVGEGRPHAAALLVMDSGEDDSEGAAAALAEAAIARVNARLADDNRLRAWALLKRPLSEEAGELTATHKVRRKVIRQRYAAEIDRLYSAGRRHPA